MLHTTRMGNYLATRNYLTVSNYLRLGAALLFNVTAWAAGQTGAELPSPMESIAIIGGGPAALTAAGRLKEKGYKDVTIFEASHVPGGKVFSHTHAGHVYELGAVVSSPDYDRDFAIAEELGIELVDTLPRQEITPHGAQISYMQRARESGGLFAIGASLRQFRKFVKTYPQVFEPGFRNLPKELYNPYEVAAKHYGLDVVSDLYRRQWWAAATVF
jgi:phytoene dehydrogenase-like protein